MQINCYSSQKYFHPCLNFKHFQNWFLLLKIAFEDNFCMKGIHFYRIDINFSWIENKKSLQNFSVIISIFSVRPWNSNPCDWGHLWFLVWHVHHVLEPSLRHFWIGFYVLACAVTLNHIFIITFINWLTWIHQLNRQAKKFYQRKTLLSRIKKFFLEFSQKFFLDMQHKSEWSMKTLKFFYLNCTLLNPFYRDYSKNRC